MTTTKQNTLVFLIRVDHKVSEVISLGLSVKRILYCSASMPALMGRQGRDSAERRVSAERSRMKISLSSSRYRWGFRHKVSRAAEQRC